MIAGKAKEHLFAMGLGRGKECARQPFAELRTVKVAVHPRGGMRDDLLNLFTHPVIPLTAGKSNFSKFWHDELLWALGRAEGKKSSSGFTVFFPVAFHFDNPDAGSDWMLNETGNFFPG